MIKEILLRRKIPLLLVLALTFGVLGGLADYLGPAVRMDENELHPPALSQQETAGAAAQTPARSYLKRMRRNDCIRQALPKS